MVFLGLNPGPADKQPLKFLRGFGGAFFKKLPQKLLGIAKSFAFG
jgi:hypothetical protein